MTRKTLLTLTVVPVLALALAGGAALAHGRGDGRMGGDRGGMAQMLPDFATLDTDKDGKVTRAEIDARRAERQKAMDPDGDGVITLDEMKAHAAGQARLRAEAMVERMFERLDTDKDGRLSAAEALAGPQDGGRGMDAMVDRMFDRVDRDGDGAISAQEYDAARARMAEGRHGRDGGRHGHGEGHGPMMPRN